MAWFNRLTNILRRTRVCDEIDEELQYHIEARTADGVAKGMSREEARANAVRRFGNATLSRERSYEADMLVWLETILQDLRYGARNLRSNPLVSAVAVLSMALAIGATTAIFSVVHTVLLRALPYQNADRIVMLWGTDKVNNSLENNTSVPNFEDWRKRTRTLENLATYREVEASFSIDGKADWIEYAAVYGDFFGLMGRAPVLGRTFVTDEPDGHQVVLSYRLWQSRFGGSPSVLGQTVQLNGLTSQIVGVMPQGFAFPSEGALLWTPASAIPGWQIRRSGRNHGFGPILGRLRPDATLDQARAEVEVISQGLAAQYPSDNADRGMRLVPLAAQVHGKTVPFMLAILSGAVLLVLLIACANVANLLLARGAARSEEIAVRSALGASNGRIVRQLLTESLLLSCLAGALGLPFAALGVRALIALAPHGIARLGEARLDVPVLVFSLGLSLATGMLFGFAPAMRISRQARNRQTTSGADSHWMRRAFVVAQVALAVVLLTGAGLLIRSFFAIQSVDPGFRTARVLAATLRFGSGLPSDRRAALYREAMARIGSLVGVRAVGAISTMFYQGNDAKFGLRAVEGRALETREQWTPMTWATVSGDYFQALGIPLLRGRFFSDEDTKNTTPVVIINETMARRYWPGTDPIGKGIKGFDARGRNDEWVRVIGVVKDMHSSGLERSPIAQIYETQSQSLDDTENLVVYTDASEAVLRNTIGSLDHSAVLTDVTTLGAQLQEQNLPRRFQTLLLSLFAALALGLAGAGIFAMMHYTVALRTKEIGIRMALGASRAAVVGMILHEGFLLVAMGCAIGLAGSLAFSRSIRSLLFEVGPGDPATLSAVSLLLAGIALLACYIPVRRATHVDPVIALRCD
ncbi:ADOP family duplicated permease [Acidicapsa dinghuensis]|uniref:ADOP family duplicated permease n=1 Tax=Acidicapsa dinghuensis TaxID=2218256 RepID=A0ABW1EBM2_9BACT|nr:ABC transporter permease [Acidicapsa dinghuensis]